MDEKPGVNHVAENAFRRHYDQIYRYVRRRTHDHHRAEDLTQQVFAEAAASLRDTGSPPLAWLYTVAKRRFADEARRRSRPEALVAATQPEYGAELGAAISDALAALPEGQRQVVVLKLLRGARFAEIARTLGVTEAAAKMRFVRALEALRAELERKGVTP
ncbi:MAG TPA: RNA polymerase sigma factor [Gaiellaceae bacterium]|nr:RNA polymerase sigma factor [Gaiellaceae bacterium]